MNAVVKQTGVHRRAFGRSAAQNAHEPSRTRDDRAKVRQFGGVAERGRIGHGHSGRTRQLQDFERVVQRAGERLVDIGRDSGRQKRPNAFEMRCTA